MLDVFREFVTSMEPIWQWFGVLLIGAIPYVESYGGALIGVVSGVATPIAITAAIVGNWLSMMLLVLFGGALHHFFVAKDKPLSPKQEKMKRTFDKYGVAGVSLVGQTILPSQLTSLAMVSFGADKKTVIFWQTIAIVLWGTVFGVLASYGIDLLNV